MLSRQLFCRARAVLGSIQGLPAARTLASAAGGSEREVLHDSMSDAFYDPKDRKVSRSEPQPLPDRPLNMRQALNSLSEPGYLMNSMSEGLYEYQPRRRIVPSRTANSMSDPLPGWLQNSMSDAHYEMPQALRGSAMNPKPPRGFSTAHRGAGSNTQRIVVVTRSSSLSDPLHDSFSHGDYTPRKR